MGKHFTLKFRTKFTHTSTQFSVANIRRHTYIIRRLVLSEFPCLLGGDWMLETLEHPPWSKRFIQLCKLYCNTSEKSKNREWCRCECNCGKFDRASIVRNGLDLTMTINSTRNDEYLMLNCDSGVFCEYDKH